MQKKGEHLAMLPLKLLKPTGYLTIAFNALPGLNLGTFLAGICIFLPVAGLIPTLDFLFITENVPKPVNTTGFPPFRAEPTVEINDSRHSLQVDLGNLVILAMLSTNLALFIRNPYDLFCLQVNKTSTKSYNN